MIKNWTTNQIVGASILLSSMLTIICGFIGLGIDSPLVKYFGWVWVGSSIWGGILLIKPKR